VADVPAWAHSMLSAALQQHGNNRRALVKAIAAFAQRSSLYDSAEQKAVNKFVIDGLQKRLAEMPAPKEAERGP
jgi:hypothetical protein